jgi:predicted Zn-dependent peptidase
MRSLQTNRVRVLLYLLLCVVFACPSVVSAESGETTLTPEELLGQFRMSKVGEVTVYFRKAESDSCAIAGIMEAGIGDQKPGEAHCAHMAEHMVFSYPLKTGLSLTGILADARSQGRTYYNGYTGLDSTTYWLSAPNESLPSLLTAFLNALFSHPLAKDAAWDNEIKRSSSELHYMTTSEIGATANRARLALLKGTPYEELMFETPLSKVTPEAVSEFMKREYSPQRLTLVITGNWEEEAVFEAIKAGLEGVEQGNPPAVRQIDLAPDPYTVLRLPSVKKERLTVVLGVDHVSPEDRTALMALWTAVASRLQRETPIAEHLTFDGLFSGFPMKTASGAMFSFASHRAFQKDAFESMTSEVVSRVRSILVEFSEGNVTKEDLEFVPPEQDPQTKAAMELLMSRISQSLIDVHAVANLLLPEMNSPGVVRSLPTQDEIQAIATKYVDNLCFTVLYTVRAAPSWKYAVLAGLMVAGIAAVFLWRRAHKARSELACP